MLRLEQKPVVLMQDILRSYSKLGAPVFDQCLATGATAKACLAENKHRKYISCDQDSACVRQMKPSLIHARASQVLNPDADINYGEGVFSVTQTFLAC